MPREPTPEQMPELKQKERAGPLLDLLALFVVPLLLFHYFKQTMPLFASKSHYIYTGR